MYVHKFNNLHKASVQMNVSNYILLIFTLKIDKLAVSNCLKY